MFLSIPKMLKKSFITVFLCVVIVKSHAGWVITEHTHGDGPGGMIERTLYIKNNMIKSVGGDQTVIFDLNQWTVTIINPDLNGYWRGAPGEYLDFIKMYTLDYLEEQISISDEEEKEILQALYEDLKMDIKLREGAVSFMVDVPVEIVMTDEVDRLLGYRVNQYIVYVDGSQAEEIWLTRDLDLSEDYNFEKYRSFIDEMSWGSMFQDFRSSETYIHLMKNGLPLKTKARGPDGSISVTEVRSIEKNDIPVTGFQPPSGYKPMSLPELQLDFP
jgi:hypothetical protein